MYPPYAYNPLAINPGMAPAADRIMPLRLLIRQGGTGGYLLFLVNPLNLIVTRGRTEGYDSVDGSAMIQIVYAMVCFLFAVHHLISRQNGEAVRILFRSPVAFFLLYTVFCGISALWSPNPKYSAFMAFQCLAFLLLTVVIISDLCRRSSPQEVIEWIVLWVLWTVFWAVVVNIRTWGLGYLKYPFQAGVLSTGVPFFIALHLCRRRAFAWITMCFAILSVANTNYFGILPAALLGAILGDRKSKVIAAAIVVVAGVGVLYFGLEAVIQNTLFFGKEGVGWEHTTGRDKVWKMGWELCMEKPVLGYGFVAGERDILYQTRGPGIISMHSMFFSAFMGVGFLGPILLSLYLAGTTMLCLSPYLAPAWRFSFIATVFMVVVVSMAGPGLGGRVYGSWQACLLVMTAIVVSCKSMPSTANGVTHMGPLDAVRRP